MQEFSYTDTMRHGRYNVIMHYSRYNKRSINNAKTQFDIVTKLNVDFKDLMR